MDTELEKMQFLGLSGVYKESYRIMFSWRKIFSQITFTLILPLSLIFLIHFEVSDVLSKKEVSHHSQEITKTQFGKPQHQNPTDHNHMIPFEVSTLYLYDLLYLTLFLIFSLLSTSAVVYTVASIYTGREVAFNKVLRVVRKVWMRLMVTFLCSAVAFLVYSFMAGAVAIMWDFTIGLKNSGGFAFIWSILYLAGLVYLIVVWQLANVVTVLEDSYAFEAMMKSKKLIKGNSGLSLIIALKLKFAYLFIVISFRMLVVNGWKVFGLGLMQRTAYGILFILMMSHFFLLMPVLHTVLYFVCKSYHHEIIDKSALSEYLQVYQGEHEPLKAKELQLECQV